MGRLSSLTWIRKCTSEFAGGFEGELVDHGTQREDLVVRVLVARPGAQQKGVARNAPLGRASRHLTGGGVAKSDAIFVATLLLRLGPPHVRVIDVLGGVPHLVRTPALRLARHAQTALVLSIRVAVGAEAAEAVKTCLFVQAELLVGAEKGGRHVLRHTGIAKHFWQLDGVLVV